MVLLESMPNYFDSLSDRHLCHLQFFMHLHSSLAFPRCLDLLWIDPSCDRTLTLSTKKWAMIELPLPLCSNLFRPGSLLLLYWVVVSPLQTCFLFAFYELNTYVAYFWYSPCKYYQHQISSKLMEWRPFWEIVLAVWQLKRLEALSGVIGPESQRTVVDHRPPLFTTLQNGSLIFLSFRHQSCRCILD